MFFIFNWILLQLIFILLNGGEYTVLIPCTIALILYLFCTQYPIR